MADNQITLQFCEQVLSHVWAMEWHGWQPLVVTIVAVVGTCVLAVVDATMVVTVVVVVGACVLGGDRH